MSFFNLVLVRHGQSVWNKEGRFTGWKDVGLSAKGIREARKASELLKKRHFVCDRAFTSVLKRAIHTLHIVLEGLDQMGVPVIKTWRLNERHYGKLTGLGKQDLIQKKGGEEVHKWRRSYLLRPPLLSAKKALGLLEIYDTGLKKKRLPFCYRGLCPLPAGESLWDTKKRLMPFWYQRIAPCLKKGQRVLVVAHGNSLRALVKHIEKINNKDIEEVNIPTATPLCYSLSKNLILKNKQVL